MNTITNRANLKSSSVGVPTAEAKDLKTLANDRARKILAEYRDTLSVSKEVADKIHQMVLEAEEKQLNLKYGKVD